MRKYNKFLALVLCASMALPFTGCSSAKEDTDNKSTSSEKTDKNDKDTEKEYAREADIYKELDYTGLVSVGDYSSIPLAKKDIEDTTDRKSVV